MESPDLSFSSVSLKETWLSRKPNSWALVVTAFATLLLVLGSVCYWQDFFKLSDLMTASHEALFTKHQLWRAWTTVLAHADQKHLLSNVLLFFILGYFLNGYFGFFIFPAMAFFFGGLTNLIILKNTAPELQVIGASGIVFWMGGVWLSLYFALERKKTLLQRTLRSVGVALLLFMPAEAFDPAVSYRSHFVGFALGVVFGFLYFWFRRDFFRSFEIYEPITDHENITCPNFDSYTNCPPPPKIDV